MKKDSTARMCVLQEKNESPRKAWAIYVITKHGVDIAKKLCAQLDDVDVYVSPKFIDQMSGDNIFELSLPMGPTLVKTFKEYNAHIHIISVGAVVRMVAPLLENKKVDPAIICIDDKCKFTVPVLSGHVGRGNEFTIRISMILDNTPVVTTASDVGGTLTVDILGRELGWVLDDMERNVTKGCAAVVNQEKVLFIQETGEPDFWLLKKDLPKGVEYTDSFEDVNASDYGIILAATDRKIKDVYPEIYNNAVIYRPKSLILGLGCDSNTPLELIERGIQKTLDDYKLDIRSVKAIASVEKKAEEPAFLQLKEKYDWEFKIYSAEELDALKNMPNPSETVKKFVGTKGVSEPSAVLGAGSEELLVEKQIYKEKEIPRCMTIAIARIPFAKRDVKQLTTI